LLLRLLQYLFFQRLPASMLVGDAATAVPIVTRNPLSPNSFAARNPMRKRKKKASPKSPADSGDSDDDLPREPREAAPPAREGAVSRLLSTPLFPSLLDFATDRVHSRLLSVVVFAVLVLFVLRAALYVLFLVNELTPVLGALSPETLVLGAQSASGATIGVALTPVTSIKLLAPDTGLVMPRESVTLALTLEAPAVDDYLFRFGYADTIYDYVGIPARSRFVFPGFVPRLLRVPLLVGATAVTRKDGVARFPRLTPALAVPGTYAATVSVPLRAFSLPGLFPSTLSTLVGDVAVFGVNPFAAAPPLAIGSRLPTLTVRIVSASGRALPGKVAALLSAPPARAELAGGALTPNSFLPRLALLGGATSTPADANGIATFFNVTLLASSLPYVRLVLVADGVVSTGPALELTVVDHVTLQLVVPPSTTAREGVPLKVQPCVRVTRAGAPARNILVMAFPAMRASFYAPDSLADPGLAEELVGVTSDAMEGILGGLGAAKHTTGFLSARSNSSGLACWSALGFLRHGPAGEYTLAFFAQGLSNVTSPVISVNSSVAKVDFWTPAVSTTGYSPTIPDKLLSPAAKAARAEAQAATAAADGTADSVGTFSDALDGPPPAAEELPADLASPPEGEDAAAAAATESADAEAAASVESPDDFSLEDVAAFADDPAVGGTDDADGGADSEDAYASSYATSSTDDYYASSSASNASDLSGSGSNDDYGAYGGSSASSSSGDRRLSARSRRTQTAPQVAADTADLSATLCTFPVCNFQYGSPAGFPVYDDIRGVPHIGKFTPGKSQTLPPRPSGTFAGDSSPAVVLHVTDALGRPLAGKRATPVLSLRLPNGREVSAAAAVDALMGRFILREFPFAGAALSRLSLPAPLITRPNTTEAKSGALIEGVLTFFRGPLRAYKKADKRRTLHAKYTGDAGAFLRFLATPPASAVPAGDLLLRFDVEGVRSKGFKTVNTTNFNDVTSARGAPFAGLAGGAPTALNATNASLVLCAALEIEASPAAFTMSASSEAAAWSRGEPSSFTGSAYRVVAYNALGLPLRDVAAIAAPLNTPSGAQAPGDDAWVAMHIVEAAGPVYFSGNASTSRPLASAPINGLLSGAHAAFLRSAGGASALLAGIQFSASLKAAIVPPAAFSKLGDGGATFGGLSLRLVRNTFFRVGFTMAYPTAAAAAAQAFDPSSCYADETSAALADFYGSVASCASPYSAALPVVSPISSLSFTGVGDSKAPALRADSDVRSPTVAELTSNLSVAAANFAQSPVDAAAFTARLFVGVDEQLSRFPAYAAASAAAYEATATAFPGARLAVCVGDNVGSNLLYSSTHPSRPPTGEVLVASALGGANFFAAVGASLLKTTAIATAFPISSAGGTFPALSALSGAPGLYNLVAYAQGVVSKPIAVSSTDNINAVLVGIPGVGSEPCPTPLSPTPTPALPGTCTSATDCASHGSCVCGVCLCAAPWTGAADCSAKLVGAPDAAIDATFTSDSFYTALLGGSSIAGVAVIDVRALMEAAQAGTSAREYFPRMILGSATVGVVSAGTTRANSLTFGTIGANLTALLGSSIESALSAGRSVRLSGSGIAASVRAGDISNNMSVSGACSRETRSCFTAPATLAEYRVVPAVVDCASGREVPTAVFLGSTSDKCLSSGDPVVPTSRSSNTLLNGSSSFSWATGDAGLTLVGLPTGCYRLRYAYAPMGAPGSYERGSLEGGTINGVLAAARAVSFGASRPFRVLSPVLRLIVEKAKLPPTFTTVIGGRLLIPPVVSLIVRDQIARGSGPAKKLEDTCYDISDLKSQINAVSYPCPPEPAKGLVVFVSLVSASDGVEYSLAVDGETFNCARAVATQSTTREGKGDFEYKATFSRLLFAAEGLPTGTFRLKFTAYGMSTLSPYTVVISTKPSWIDVPNLDASILNSVIATARVGDGTDVVPPIRATPKVFGVARNFASAVYTKNNQFAAALVAADEAAADAAGALAEGLDPGLTALSSDPLADIEPSYEDGTPGFSDLSIKLPQASVSAMLLAGPPDANARLASTGLRVLSDLSGTAQLSSVKFTSGVSGLYALLITAAGYDAGVAVLVNVTNPVQGVTVKGVAETTPLTPLLFIKNTKVAVAWTVCAKHASGLPLVNETLTMRSYLETENAVSAKAAAARPKTPPPLSVGSALSKTATPSPTPRTAKKKSVPRGKPPSLSSVAPVSSLQLIDASAARSDAVIFALNSPLSESRSFADVGTWLESPQALKARGVPAGRGALLRTGADGCATVNSVTLTKFARSVRLRLIFTARGVDSAPVHAAALTLQDANPTTPADLRARILLPLFLTIPVYAANTLWSAPPARLAAALLSGLSYYFLWKQGGELFWVDVKNFLVSYAAADVRMITILNALYSAALLLAALVSFVLLVDTLAAVAAGRRSTAAADAAPPLARSRLYDPATARGFFSAKMRASLAYARAALRGRIEPLLELPSSSTDAGVSPLLLDALDEIFLRFALLAAPPSGGAVAGAEAAARATALLVKRDAKAAKLPELPKELGAVGAAALAAVLASVHLGPTAPAAGSDDLIGSTDAAVDEADFARVLAFRLATFGATQVAKDMRVLAAYAGPLASEELRGVDWATLFSADVEGGDAAADVGADTPRAAFAPEAARVLAAALAARPLRVTAAGRAIVARIAGGLAAKEQLSWTTLLECLASGTRPTLVALRERGAALSSAQLAALFHARLLPRAGAGLERLVLDGPVWAELRALGYDAALRRAPVDGAGVAAPHARAAVALFLAEARARGSAKRRKAAAKTVAELAEALWPPADAEPCAAIFPEGAGGAAGALARLAGGAHATHFTHALPKRLHAATLDEINERLRWMRLPVLDPASWHAALVAQAAAAGDADAADAPSERVGADGFVAYALARYGVDAAAAPVAAPGGTGVHAFDVSSAAAFFATLLRERGHGPTGAHAGSAAAAAKAFADDRFAARTAKGAAAKAYATFLREHVLAAFRKDAAPAPSEGAKASKGVKVAGAKAAARAKAGAKAAGKAAASKKGDEAAKDPLPGVDALVEAVRRGPPGAAASVRVSARSAASQHAFFYPQRLLVAIGLSALLVFFSALVCVQSAVGTMTAVQEAFDKVNDLAGAGLSSMADGLTAATARVDAALKATRDVALKASAAETVIAEAGSAASIKGLASSLASSTKAVGASLSSKLALASAAVAAADPGQVPGAGASAAVLGLLTAADLEGDDAGDAAADAARELATTQLADIFERTVASAVAYASALSPDPEKLLAASGASAALTAAMNKTAAQASALGLSPARLGFTASNAAALSATLQNLAAGRISARDAGGTLLLSMLGEEFIGAEREVRRFIITRMWASIGVSLSLAFLFVNAALFAVLTSYRAMMLRARRGEYPGGASWRWPSPVKAWKLVGAQMGLAFVVYFLIFFVVLIVAFILSLIVAELWVWRRAFDIAWPIVLSSLSVVLVQTIAETTFVNNVLLAGRNIAYPRPYSVADVWFSIAGLFIGAAVAFTRVITGIVQAVASLARTDQTSLSARSADVSVAAFDATLAIDMQHSNPLLLAAVHCLTLERTPANAAEVKDDKVGKDGMDGSKEGKVAGGKVAKGKAKGKVAAEDDERAKRVARSRRARTRWFLALTLSRNPELVAERRRNATKDGAILPPPSLGQKLGLSVPKTVEGPAGPAYHVWADSRGILHKGSLKARDEGASAV
jgi:hypothetical protein